MPKVAQNLDRLDISILDALQHDGRITNRELAKAVSLSPSPSWRRLRALEEAGLIRGYHAEVDARELGFEVQVFVMVGLDSQAEAELRAFEGRCRDWPLVRECHMLTGEVDFVLKVVAPDWDAWQTFLTSELTPAPNVASVKTAPVLRHSKKLPGVPLDATPDGLR